MTYTVSSGTLNSSIPYHTVCVLLIQLQEASLTRDKELQKLDVIENEADQRFPLFARWNLYLFVEFRLRDIPWLSLNIAVHIVSLSLPDVGLYVWTPYAKYLL